jgi:hypothetical protein
MKDWEFSFVGHERRRMLEERYEENLSYDDFIWDATEQWP